MTQNKSYKDILDASVSVGEREMKKEHRQRFVCMCVWHLLKDSDILAMMKDK